MLGTYDSDVLWLVVIGFIVAFVLAFGIGANDVANSFGTSVGSKVLTLKQACIVASIFELAGAVLIGAKVSDTVRKGIIDINSFNGTEEMAMVGSVSALGGTSIWLIVATFFRLPVSGTHSVVGATMGYALVQHGLNGVYWKKFGMIAGSWIISPVLSGITSCLVFFFINMFILRKDPSFEFGVKLLPFFYSLTTFVILFSIFYKGSHLLRFNTIPLYGVLILAIGGSIICALVVYFFVGPWLKRKIIRDHNKAILEEKPELVVNAGDCDTNENSAADAKLINEADNLAKEQHGHDHHAPGSNESDSVGLVVLNGTASSQENTTPKANDNCAGDCKGTKEIQRLLEEGGQVDQKTASLIARQQVTDEPKTGRLFSFLQIMTASFGAFAHGGNDVSNAIGPVVTLWVVYQTGGIASKTQTPIWILLYGGVGIIVGLCVWGRRVIKTMGEDLTPITPSSGFSIEVGSALTVLLASRLGIPISTTHCKVGSVVMVGRYRSKSVVDWSLFRNIVLSWIVTMPCAGLLSAGIYAALREAI